MNQVVMMDPADLTPYENNPRDNDGAVEAVANSIREFGFKAPIIVDRDHVIIAGHTRLKAALSLGLKEVPVIVADDLSPEQVRAYRLADNKTGEQATWLETMLAEELAAIEGIDMSQFGFEGQSAEDAIDSIGAGDGFESEEVKLTERFIVPPFSVFDAKQGYWVERARAWTERTGEKGQGRPGSDCFNLIMDSRDNGISILNPALCEVIVAWFMPKDGGRCFDPFASDTNFGFVASSMGKEYTGIELRQEQVEFNTGVFRRHGLKARYICDDGQNVAKHIPPASQDLLFSCPPYYDLEVYSDLPNDASNQPTYEGYLRIIETAFDGAIKCLKDDRFAVIVVGDVRDEAGGYRDLVGDVKGIFVSRGMMLYNDIVLVTPYGTAAMRAQGNMRSRKVVKAHQNVLVFYKGDPAHIKDAFGDVEVMDMEGAGIPKGGFVSHHARPHKGRVVLERLSGAFMSLVREDELWQVEVGRKEASAIARAIAEGSGGPIVAQGEDAGSSIGIRPGPGGMVMTWTCEARGQGMDYIGEGDGWSQEFAESIAKAVAKADRYAAKEKRREAS